MEKTYNIAIKASLEAGKRILEIYNTDDFQVTEKSDHSPLTKADKAAHNIIVSYLEGTGIPILSEEGRDIPYKERKSWTKFWLVDPLDGTKEFIKRNGEFTVNIALIENGKPIFGVVYAPVLKDLYVGIVGEGAWLLSNQDDDVEIDQIRINGNRLPAPRTAHRAYRLIASRSHMSQETTDYIETLKSEHPQIEILSKGSSLKLCLVASGEADEYPRLGPTMEWDIGAAHAVVAGAGKTVKIFGSTEDLKYNKEDLLNPYFLVK
jgi:3'(2'), 5'-bisphosphate nucleotidase